VLTLLPHCTPAAAAAAAAAGERFAPLLPGMCACIAQLPAHQQGSMRKLLASWRTESVLDAATLTACEAALPAAAAGAGAGAASAAATAAAAAARQMHHARGVALAAGGYVQAAAPAGGARSSQQLTPAKRVSTLLGAQQCRHARGGLRGR
jgi:hypothetical protein